MSKVILQGHIEVPPEDLAAVQDELARHITLTRAEAGCLVFQVEQDATRPGYYSVYEEFEDERAFTLHQERVASSHWGEVSKRAIRHYEVTREL